MAPGRQKLRGEHLRLCWHAVLAVACGGVRPVLDASQPLFVTGL